MGQFATSNDLPRTPLLFYSSNGTSYTSRIANALSKDSPLIFVNLGQPGALTLNVWNEQTPRIPRYATLVTIYAGIADETLIAQSGSSIEEGFTYRATLPFWEEALRQLIAGVRMYAPRARIVIANIPNLGYYPAFQDGGVNPKPADIRALYSNTSIAMTRYINGWYDRGVDVVDLHCDSRLYASDVFANDLHPNDKGYALIADDFWKVLRTQRGARPSSRCPPYTTSEAAR